MTAIVRSCLAVLLALAMVGCATGSRGRGAPEGVGIFGADASKLQKGSGDDWARVYRKPGVDFAGYDKLILDPIGIWADANSSLKKLSAADRQRIAEPHEREQHRAEQLLGQRARPARQPQQSHSDHPRRSELERERDSRDRLHGTVPLSRRNRISARVS